MVILECKKKLFGAISGRGAALLNNHHPHPLISLGPRARSNVLRLWVHSCFLAEHFMEASSTIAAASIAVSINGLHCRESGEDAGLLIVHRLVDKSVSMGKLSVVSVSNEFLVIGPNYCGASRGHDTSWCCSVPINRRCFANRNIRCVPFLRKL